MQHRITIMVLSMIYFQNCYTSFDVITQDENSVDTDFEELSLSSQAIPIHTEKRNDRLKKTRLEQKKVRDFLLDYERRLSRQANNTSSKEGDELFFTHICDGITEHSNALSLVTQVYAKYKIAIEEQYQTAKKQSFFKKKLLGFFKKKINDTYWNHKQKEKRDEQRNKRALEQEEEQLLAEFIEDFLPKKKKIKNKDDGAVKLTATMKDFFYSALHTQDDSVKINSMQKFNHLVNAKFYYLKHDQVRKNVFFNNLCVFLDNHLDQIKQDSDFMLTKLLQDKKQAYLQKDINLLPRGKSKS